MSSVIRELLYRNYACNRRLSPQVTPKEWEVVYGQNVEQMEARFQEQIQKKHSLLPASQLAMRCESTPSCDQIAEERCDRCGRWLCPTHQDQSGLCLNCAVPTEESDEQHEPTVD